MVALRNLTRRIRRQSLRRFHKAQSGATALEFGIIAAPFFALLFALIEVGLVFFATFTLENAVAEASRLIRTGQAQGSGFSETEFKQQVCNNVYGLIDCGGGLIVDVRKFDDFGSVSLPDPLDGDGNLTGTFGYDAGDGGDIVVVRVFYEWDLIADLPGAGLGNMAGGKRLLTATAAFRNEPFNN